MVLYEPIGGGGGGQQVTIIIRQKKEVMMLHLYDILTLIWPFFLRGLLVGGLLIPGNGGCPFDVTAAGISHLGGA